MYLSNKQSTNVGIVLLHARGAGITEGNVHGFSNSIRAPNGLCFCPWFKGSKQRVCLTQQSKNPLLAMLLLPLNKRLLSLCNIKITSYHGRTGH